MQPYNITEPVHCFTEGLKKSVYFIVASYWQTHSDFN